MSLRHLLTGRWGGVMPHFGGQDMAIVLNIFDSKAGTTARAIETLMGQYFD